MLRRTEGYEFVRLTRCILALSVAIAAPVYAQSGQMVQATPPAEAVAALNRHLASLSRNPQDVNALLGAGQAALDLGDVQAANGFFTRANMVDGRNGRARLGLAVVQIALKQPAEAAANFDAAAALGVGAQAHLAERAMAYDLTGQQAKAQQDYRAALQMNPADRVAQLRYAVSLGISGNLAEAEQQLQPALGEGDREAWRMRAFILAMNGRIADARSIMQSSMPKGLAEALDPYMQRLPLLSATQKASAVHYGEYPANVLRLAAPEPVRARDAQAVASAERDGSGRRQTAAERRAAERAARQARRTQTASKSKPVVVTTAPAPASQPSSPASNAAPPPPARAASNSSQPSTDRSAVSNSGATAAVVQQPPSRAAVPQRAAQSSVTQPTPAASDAGAARPTAQTPSPPAQPARSLGDTLQALEVPEQERRQVAVADLETVARIQEQRRAASAAAAAKAKVEAEARAKAEAARKAEAERKAKLAANPSRNWVQLAAGRDPDALAFDLRRLRRTYGETLAGHDGWTSAWGETRRLLIGPFRRPEDARAVVAELRKAGSDAFFWQSEAGEEVAKIGGQ